MKRLLVAAVLVARSRALSRSSGRRRTPREHSVPADSSTRPDEGRADRAAVP